MSNEHMETLSPSFTVTLGPMKTAVSHLCTQWQGGSDRTGGNVGSSRVLPEEMGSYHCRSLWTLRMKGRITVSLLAISLLMCGLCNTGVWFRLWKNAILLFATEIKLEHRML